MARRSDPFGWKVNVELSAQPGYPIRRVIIDLVDDGERPIFDVTIGDMDVHALRGLFAKPVRNGTFDVVVMAVDATGCVGRSAPGPRVSVTF